MNPRACGAPGCSAEIPVELDEYGARGWFDMLIIFRPLAHGAERIRRIRLCPSHAGNAIGLVNA